LLGVIDGLRLSSDPDTNMLSLGCELTSLGLNLNSPTPLYTTLTSVYNPASLDMNNGATGTNGSNNHFIIPSCYRVNLNSCDISRVDQVTLMSDDALLMAFYAFPRDRVQEAAAQELHSRGWRFHKDIKVWLCKEEQTVSISEIVHGDRGVFVFFDPANWQRVKKEWVVVGDVLEER
ncbi:hypothetical protein BJ741DRAFT_513376, partial [Chytriomyces cf. hyalinus JEL632]